MPQSEAKNSLRSKMLLIGVPVVLAWVLGFWLLPGQGKPHSEIPLYGGQKLLEARESLYNNIFIYSDGPNVSMTFGYNKNIFTESIYNTTDERDLPVLYTRYMTTGLMYAGSLKSILEIGFGGGRTSWYLHRYLPNVPITSVELDPEIVELAHKYFGIKDEPNFKVVNQDGRLFLANTKDKYDIILVDAYRGPFVPFHLLTKEFYQLVKDHLNPGGVVVQNIEPTTMLFDSAVATIKSVFSNIEFYVSEGNVVTVAYDGASRSENDLAAMAAERQKQLNLRYNLLQLFQQRRLLKEGAQTIDPNAKILTDDFAPVETLKAVTAHNRKWQEK